MESRILILAPTNDLIVISEQMPELKKNLRLLYGVILPKFTYLKNNQVKKNICIRKYHSLITTILFFVCFAN